MPAKRKYKDSVFTSLFKDKKRLLELYNAIEGTSYKDPNIININTLDGVLFPNRQNDISFTKAVLYCIDKGILRDYLRQHSSEVVNMLSTKFKLKDAIAVAKEEGEENGIKKVFALLEKGIPLAEAKRRLGVTRNYAR
ncbi:MAG: hypothetical protein FWF67_00715 [Fibromonadales bacterium]|nr:hypothetical protein [Fibromonadales bacterium]